jgi:hypothetical protein
VTAPRTRLRRPVDPLDDVFGPDDGSEPLDRLYIARAVAEPFSHMRWRPPVTVCGRTGTVTVACMGTAAGCGYGTCPGPVSR